jgi:hypothetical protein
MVRGVGDTRKTGNERGKLAILRGIGGLVLLTIGLTIQQPFIGIVGIVMTLIGVEGEERGIRAGICGMVLIVFGLTFDEPFRAIIGCTMTLIGIIMWRARGVRKTNPPAPMPPRLPPRVA